MAGICDRITRWENYTYQKNLAFAGTREEWGRYQAAIARRYNYARAGSHLPAAAVAERPPWFCNCLKVKKSCQSYLTNGK